MPEPAALPLWTRSTIDLTTYQLYARKTRNGEPNLLVAALGLCGESAELSAAIITHGVLSPKAREECGDVLWYTSMAAECIGADLDSLSPHGYATIRAQDHPDRTALKLCISTGLFVDEVKKQYAQGHERNEGKLILHLRPVFEGICRISHLSCRTIEGIAAGNIKKLQKRYPEGFTADRSVNRSKSNDDL